MAEEGCNTEVIAHVVQQAPILQVPLTPCTTKLVWSTANYVGKKVNLCAIPAAYLPSMLSQ
jgi:hypothetical protein